MNFDEICEKYGLQGEFFVNKIRDEIEFQEKRGWKWELRILQDNRYSLVLALVNRFGVTIYTFSKFHQCFAGVYSLDHVELEEILKRATEFWEREPKCLESNSV